MKMKLSYVVFIAMVMVFTNCKKDTSVKPDLTADGAQNTAALTMSGVPVNSVITIAGKPYTKGSTLIDGPGKNARFAGPSGIQLMNDGTIYVADTRNNVIRVVSPAADVTTFSVPNNNIINPLFWLKSPEYVGVDDNGVVFTIDHNPDTQTLRIGFYKPTGDFFGGLASDYHDMRDLVKDPYSNAFWSSDGTTIGRFTARKSDSNFNYTFLTFTNKFLPVNPDDPYSTYTYPAIFAGYNGVIYFTYNGKLYKHSKDNTGAVIFPDLNFDNITCIRGTKDSKTLYIADNGFIKRIDNGKLSTITGPNKNFTDSRDGIGSAADVSAKYLALSQDESTIYFSDSRANAIRKIVLR